MSDGYFETPDGCRLAFVDEGEGTPVLWQHGLGADRHQPGEVFPAMDGIRRITLECRGHGLSALGDVSALSIAQFADDAAGLLDHLDIERAVVGGISLGAAVALRMAGVYPGRVSALVMARPAWACADSPTHLQIYRDVAELLAKHGVDDGERRFELSKRLAEVEAVSPDNAASLRGFFRRVNTESTVALLGRIPTQGPGLQRREFDRLTLPTLVIANRQDYVHPVDTAEELAAHIAGSTLRIITSKSISRDDYIAEFKRTIREFLAPMRNRP
ncbi:Putative hydrolases or acyltransferases (alpha/beta hydrolase superfamily) [Paraburkholderia caribensis MBA4]|uniref:Hydrolases or acyltransferases (Alpha/beta hydrolase superfamily) n=1 Tax=Paraburkholderia caribensis MBA4 TaxID=1323664 RepID=A0A0N7JV84_9BURK|nr:alpha/beta hydrolase [Paraburkholderia caribensis]ALL68501.1 Putative hydrolases or acyltransferases (alpha/beta hydrolase superfamily) [Paraburkholderia caribensis MBA4]